VAATPAGRWVLLIHQIPPKPDYLRVKIGRRLQRIGAVAIKNSVYVLPAGDTTIEDFHWLRREIVADGGEASVCHASFVDGLTDADVEALFRTARSAEYDTVADTAAHAAKLLSPRRAADAEAHAQVRTELARLKRRLADVTAIDFFGAPRRAAAEEAVGLLEIRLRRATAKESASVTAPEPASTTLEPGTVQGRTWVTRAGVFVDRMASAWLIRRFIDPQARFAFVGEGYIPRPGELRFDMFEAEFTHEGDRCTFETLVARFGLRTDQALRAIGEIVHDIDVKDAKYARSEAAGVERLVAGVAATYPTDVDRVEHGATLFDALYEAFRPAPVEPGGTSRSRSKHARRGTPGR
jgi:hypothetical protein